MYSMVSQLAPWIKIELGKCSMSWIVFLSFDGNRRGLVCAQIGTWTAWSCGVKVFFAVV